MILLIVLVDHCFQMGEKCFQSDKGRVHNKLIEFCSFYFRRNGKELLQARTWFWYVLVYLSNLWWMTCFGFFFSKLYWFWKYDLFFLQKRDVLRLLELGKNTQTGFRWELSAFPFDYNSTNNSSFFASWRINMFFISCFSYGFTKLNDPLWLVWYGVDFVTYSSVKWNVFKILKHLKIVLRCSIEQLSVWDLERCSSYCIVNQ